MRVFVAFLHLLQHIDYCVDFAISIWYILYSVDARFQIVLVLVVVKALLSLIAYVLDVFVDSGFEFVRVFMLAVVLSLITLIEKSRFTVLVFALSHFNSSSLTLILIPVVFSSLVVIMASRRQATEVLIIVKVDQLINIFLINYRHSWRDFTCRTLAKQASLTLLKSRPFKLVQSRVVNHLISAFMDRGNASKLLLCGDPVQQGRIRLRQIRILSVILEHLSDVLLVVLLKIILCILRFDQN